MTTIHEIATGRHTREAGIIDDQQCEIAFLKEQLRLEQDTRRAVQDAIRIAYSEICSVTGIKPLHATGRAVLISLLKIPRIAAVNAYLGTKL